MGSDTEPGETPHECPICGDALLGFTESDMRAHLVENGERHARILAEQVHERARENVDGE